MTEEQWLACEDPQRLLELVRSGASDRKARLYACALARRVWDKLTQPERTALEVAERFADGLGPPQEREAAELALYLQPNEPSARGYGSNVYFVLCAVSSPAYPSVGHAFRYTVEAFGLRHALADVLFRTEDKARARLLRDIFNPCHPQAGGSLPSASDGLALAHAAYDERHLPEGALDRARLAILADALEDAGCADAELLGHLRSPGPHVRGCWALDLILGKS